jgi:hypothetical protein
MRSVSGVLRNGHGAAATSSESTASGDAPAAPAAGQAPVDHPFAWPDDDPVSRAVRAGCDVVDKAVRRGFGLGRDPSSGSAAAPPWAGAGLPGPLTGRWTTGQWVDAMTGAFTWWAQWFDTWSSMARSAMRGGAESAAGAWPPPPSSSAPAPAPVGPASPSPATGALQFTVELRTPRAVSVELDLAPRPASGSSPGVAATLEVHGLLAPAAAAAPPITDVTIAVVERGFAVTLGSIELHPAGTYAGAVLAAGRACGTLTVRLT